MNNSALRSTLKTLSREEQIIYLTDQGFPPEKITDYLNRLMLSSESEVEANRPVKIVPRNDIKKRIKDREAETQRKHEEEKRRKLQLTPAQLAEEEEALKIEKQRLNSELEEKRKTNLFRTDINKNRKMLGGKTIYDKASLYNPSLKQTQVIQWYREIFTQSGCYFSLLFGSVGSGKTWGTIAYVNSISDNPCFIAAYRMSEMMASQRKFQDELDSFTRKKALIIDDLGCEPPGYRGTDFLAFFEYLVDERYKRCLTTFITSNLTSSKFKEIYGERIVSRFNEIGLFKETTDPDFRTSKN